MGFGLLDRVLVHAPQAERGSGEHRHHRQDAQGENQMAQPPRARRLRPRRACMLIRSGRMLPQTVPPWYGRKYKRDCPAASWIVGKPSESGGAAWSIGAA